MGQTELDDRTADLEEAMRSIRQGEMLPNDATDMDRADPSEERTVH